ncbi:MAG: hypothetical protein LBI53_05470 [Candidatus Peribacteria bacterium]|jgi:hypothetical protein|nr:hypothetical protein [Candidatus Peribacteria bacterium]
MNINTKSEFYRLQKDLNTIEKSVNFVEKADLQKEKISQKLDKVMEKIDELTKNEAGKLETQEALGLQQQIERIKLKVGIVTKANLNKLQATVMKHPTLQDRPPEVQKGIQESAKNIETIAQGNDKNPIASLMQKGIKRLLE